MIITFTSLSHNNFQRTNTLLLNVCIDFKNSIIRIVHQEGKTVMQLNAIKITSSWLDVWINMTQDMHTNVCIHGYSCAEQLEIHSLKFLVYDKMILM